MYAAREVFPNSPLEYAVAEVRYPYAPRLRQDGIRDAILLELEDLFPILKPVQLLTVTGAVGGPVSPQFDQVPRAFSRSRRTGLAVTANALTLDTTDYNTFDEFRSMINRCLLAVDKHASPAALERVGLRYVNEIRVPEAIIDARDWRGWVADVLVGPATLDNSHGALELQGAVQYTTGQDQRLTFRFSAAREGSVVGDGPLRRRNTPGSVPFFVLDLDSYWEPPTDMSPTWASETVMKIIDELHEPVGAAFQSAITDKLRESVLRRNP